MTTKKILTWDEVEQLVLNLWGLLGDRKLIMPTIYNVYGIPRGGQFVAMMLSNASGLPLTNVISPNTLIVDDIVDSGSTLEKFRGQGCGLAALHIKPHASIMPHCYVQTTEDWIVYPWEEAKDETIQDNVKRIFEFIGEKPDRVGLKGTPDRIERMYIELYKGYDGNKLPEVTVFPNGRDGIIYDQMVTDEGTFYSTCEHHQMPFFGRYYFGYIPNIKGRILGLSKVARVIDYYCSRLQVQERIVQEVINYLWRALDDHHNPPLGMILIFKGKHLCKSMRGVKKEGFMTSSAIKGVFRDKPESRLEFFELIKLKGNID